MDRKKLEEAVKKALEDKGKRKFKQSVELIINTRGIDFTKPENRLNLNIVLPRGRGKQLKVAVFADGEVADKAKKAGADLVITSDKIEEYKDKGKVKELAKKYALLAEPKLMGLVAKTCGQYLGRKGKLPRPLVGNVESMVKSARDSIRIVSKGKYLPTIHALIGSEDMEASALVENAEAVLEGIKSKVPEGNIKSLYVKLTMGKPVKV